MKFIKGKIYKFKTIDPEFCGSDTEDEMFLFEWGNQPFFLLLNETYGIDIKTIKNKLKGLDFEKYSSKEFCDDEPILYEAIVSYKKISDKKYETCLGFELELLSK